MENLTYLFLPVSIWFQQVGDWLIPIMKGVTFLGNVEFYLLIMPLLYWCLDLSLGIRIGILLLVSGGFNSILKFAFGSPRPFWVSTQVQRLTEAYGFGFPSGHAQSAASNWGLLAVTIKKAWVTTLALIVILLIGLSRIFLGVHFLHDVLAGWLIGSLLLWIFIRLEPGIISWFKQNSLGMRLIGLVLVTGLFILPAIFIVPPLNYQPLNPDFVDIDGNPYSYDDLLTNAGAFFGLGLGIIFLEKKGTFNTKEPVWKLILRYLIGIVGILLLYAGLGRIFPNGTNLAAYTLRFIRYSLIGLWISFAAPVVFSWLKLTEFNKT